MNFILLSVEKCVFSFWFGATCTPTKSNLYFDSSFDTVTNKYVPYRLFKFQVPNLIFIFHRLGLSSKELFQVWGSLKCVVMGLFFTVRDY
jgi:hypothetical protein